MQSENLVRTMVMLVLLGALSTFVHLHASQFASFGRTSEYFPTSCCTSTSVAKSDELDNPMLVGAILVSAFPLAAQWSPTAGVCFRSPNARVW